MNTYACTHIHRYTQTHFYMHAITCMHMCSNIYIIMYTQTHVLIYTCTHSQVHKHTHPTQLIHNLLLISLIMHTLLIFRKPFFLIPMCWYRNSHLQAWTSSWMRAAFISKEHKLIIILTSHCCCMPAKPTVDSCFLLAWSWGRFPPSSLERENGYGTDSDNKCFIGEKRKIKSLMKSGWA